MKELVSIPHKYQEIRDYILSRIESGHLNSGERLPGVRILGEQFGCNYHTVRHAFETLASQGFVERKRGSGTFVTDRATDLKKRKVSIDKVLRFTDRLGVLLPLKQWGHHVTSLIDQLHHTAEQMEIKLNIRTVTDIDIHSASLAQEFRKQECCAILLPWIGEDQCPVGLHDFVRASELPVVMASPVHGLESNCYWDPRFDYDVHRSDTFLQCNYLRRVGYKKIALLGPVSEDSEHFQKKLMEYTRWCDNADFSSLIGLVDRSPDEYERVIKRWLPYCGNVAVIAYHDEIALEFMNALSEGGISVPQDIAVLGHNNNPNGRYAQPQLSTMQLPYDHIAKGMIRHARALSEGDTAQVEDRIQPVLYIRDSCGGKMRLGQSGLDRLMSELTADV